ncbi:RNA binding motif protein 12Ba [Myripristis murdjan]|uniref:RNA binding motif protein 12Ba n=1 Tax=Myripristis murdjan TaxID=586833 RepID=UPI001175DCCD|nr:RNA-binding protein 12B [Myripristis murdjan]
MPIILRLQGLDVKAGTEDIRKFFESLYIPEGGVYIVGGNLREAFIAFTTQRDGQLAMRRTGNFLKGSKVSLHISSMDELEQKLTSKLKKKATSPPPPPVLKPQPSAADQAPSNATSADPCTALLLGLVTVLQGFQSHEQEENNEAVSPVDAPKADSPGVVSDQTPEEACKLRPGYVRLFGLPASVTKEDICHFFKGLLVQEVIVNVKLGLGRACLVKFANFRDGCDALHFNNQLLGSIHVEVRGASEKMWTSALQECENSHNLEETAEEEAPTDIQNNPKTRPPCDPLKPRRGPLEETESHKQQSTSKVQTKRRSNDSLDMQPQKKPRYDCDSTNGMSPPKECTVMVSNLPNKITKTEIKELFGCPSIPHNKILHLLDKEGNRTDTAFLTLDRTEDYDYALNLNGCHVGSQAIEVSAITKERMEDMLATSKAGCVWKPLNIRLKGMKKPKTGRPGINPAAQTCLFVRNMPADVRKSQLKNFFRKYELVEDNIFLLHDSDGNGIGEAVVQFKSQKLAAQAQGLHGQVFLGTQVLLARINVKQMREILMQTF